MAVKAATRNRHRQWAVRQPIARPVLQAGRSNISSFSKPPAVANVLQQKSLGAV
jgi:hypothetical protein